MNATDTTRLQTMARKLCAGAAMTALTLVALVAVAIVATTPPHRILVLTALLGSGAVGLHGLWLGIRTGFDAAIFARWAREAANDSLDLAAFDATMVRCGLMPAAKAGRSLDARVAGATGLLRQHGLTLAIQISLLALALVLRILER